MTPLGPHAMTAQAGAVAWRAVATEDGSSPQIVWIAMPVSSWAIHDAANGICTIEYAYPTPPAAVPVEALEGLVADMRVSLKSVESMLPGKYILGYEEALDHLIERLIKERSNG